MIEMTKVKSSKVGTMLPHDHHAKLHMIVSELLINEPSLLFNGHLFIENSSTDRTTKRPPNYIICGM